MSLINNNTKNLLLWEIDIQYVDNYLGLQDAVLPGLPV
jgi:hypothetical protein